MRKDLIIAGVFILLVLGGYFLWRSGLFDYQKLLSPGAPVGLPENEFEGIPQINPASGTNPFSNVKINPFE